MFKEFHKGAQARLKTLCHSVEYSLRVEKVLYSLYPQQKQKGFLKEVSYDRKKKSARVVAKNKSVASKLFLDRHMIKAALRGEGLDVKELVIS